MSNLSHDERQKTDVKHFAGPDRSYPVMDCEDVQDAWDLAGQAFDPDQIRTNVIRLAKEKGCDMPHAGYKHRTQGAASFSQNDTPRTITSLTYLRDNALFTDNPPPGYVRRSGKIFQVGDYPDHQFSLTEQEADRAIAAFAPKEADVEHKDTVLSGHLGILRKVWREGTAIFGSADVPEWLHGILTPTKSQISCAWDRATKTLEGWGWVLDPAISDAALFNRYATFSASQQQLLASMPVVSNEMVNTTGGNSQTQAQVNFSQPKKRGPNMKLLDALGRVTASISGQNAEPNQQQTQQGQDNAGGNAGTANFSGIGVTQPVAAATPTQVPIDQLVAQLQGYAAIAPQQAQIQAALAALQGNQANFTQQGQAQGQGQGNQGQGQVVASFAAPGATAEEMDEGVATFKAAQIKSRAEEQADKLIADGRVYSAKRNALIACFTAAGYDNEEHGPSLVTFTKADKAVLNDRVAMIVEAFADGPRHALFDRAMQVQVMNGSPDAAANQSAEAQGKAQAAKANAERYGHLAATVPEIAAAVAASVGR